MLAAMHKRNTRPVGRTLPGAPDLPVPARIDDRPSRRKAWGRPAVHIGLLARRLPSRRRRRCAGMQTHPQVLIGERRPAPPRASSRDASGSRLKHLPARATPRGSPSQSGPSPGNPWSVSADASECCCAGKRRAARECDESSPSGARIPATSVARSPTTRRVASAWEDRRRDPPGRRVRPPHG